MFIIEPLVEASPETKTAKPCQKNEDFTVDEKNGDKKASLCGFFQPTTWAENDDEMQLAELVFALERFGRIGYEPRDLQQNLHPPKIG